MSFHMSFHDASLPGERFTSQFVPPNEQHNAAYRMRFASYVRKGGKACAKADDVPEQLRTRVLLVRSFDKDATFVADELVEGRDIEAAIERQLADSRTAYLHIYYALPGRYMARVERE